MKANWAKIDNNIYYNPKWFIISEYILREKNIDITPASICNVYMYYIFMSKNKFKSIDVRKIDVMKSDILLKNRTIKDINDLNLINEYFIRMDLLNRKYQLKHYYEWNEKDLAKSQSETGKTQSENAKTSQSRKVYETKEYFRLQRLKAKAKKSLITPEETEEMEQLKIVINSQSRKVSQSIAKNSQSPRKDAIEYRNKNIEIKEKKINKKKETLPQVLNCDLSFSEESFEEKESKVISREGKNLSENFKADEFVQVKNQTLKENSDNSNFEELWKLYGKVGSKQQALKTFEKLKITDEILTQITNGITNYVKKINSIKNGNFNPIQHFSTFLNKKTYLEYQERFLSELDKLKLEKERRKIFDGALKDFLNQQLNEESIKVIKQYKACIYDFLYQELDKPNIYEEKQKLYDFKDFLDQDCQLKYEREEHNFNLNVLVKNVAKKKTCFL